MSYRLGCEAPDLVAAIAPVSAVLANKPNLAMQSTQKFECNRSSSSTGTGTGGNGRLVPVLHIHGTQDQLVTYAGNPLFEWPSVVSTVLSWVGGGANGGHNNSSSSSSSIMPVTTFENKSTVTNNSVLCQNYGEDFNVTLCTVTGGTHAWPGGRCGGSYGPVTTPPKHFVFR